MPTRSNLGAKDYELIAGVLADTPDLDDDHRFGLALDFAERLLATSDSFDPVRFVSACTRVIEDEIREELLAAGSTAMLLRLKALAARRRMA